MRWGNNNSTNERILNVKNRYRIGPGSYLAEALLLMLDEYQYVFPQGFNVFTFKIFKSLIKKA